MIRNYAIFPVLALAAGFFFVADPLIADEQRLEDRIAWGAETNHIKAGLYWETNWAGKTFKPWTKFVPAFCGASTNEELYWIPPEPERYRVVARDSKGIRVPMTEKGKTMGRAIPAKPKLIRPRQGGGPYEPYGFSRSPVGPEFFLPTFKPSDFFIFEKPGNYEFEWQVRLVRTISSNIDMVVFPPVKVEIVVEPPAESQSK
jgi:hypothetical protein